MHILAEKQSVEDARSPGFACSTMHVLRRRTSRSGFVIAAPKSPILLPMGEYTEPIREPKRLRDRLRRRARKAPPTASAAAPFEPREIACEGREAARIEAERQEAIETEPTAEWIYLKPEQKREWIARRTLRNPDPEPSKRPFLVSLIAALLNEWPP